MPEEYDDPEGRDNLDEPPAFFPREETGSIDPAHDGTLVEVRVEGIFEDVSSGPTARFVIVQDEFNRKVPIAIGGFEALAILDALEGRVPARPMTHDLFKGILERLGATLVRVAIDDLWSEVYYAKVFLTSDHDDEEILIDARPSDAIAMALRFKAPIYMSESLLQAAAEQE